MKNSSYSKAKVLTLIPIFVLAVTVICLVLAAILEPLQAEVCFIRSLHLRD